ncbi:MAG: acetate--CoA ligase family protein [Proteobacteria bacterium]|nr:acetate--CoA ligase family protein [Pseudomonadota bacterium]
MNFLECAAKPLLAAAGIAVPQGIVTMTADGAANAARELGGPVVVKAQVPAGKRGKSGGVRPADDPEGARAVAEAILRLEIGGHPVMSLLVERRAKITAEYYAAVINDPASQGPLILFSTLGGMEIEEAANKDPRQVRRLAVDIRKGLDRATAAKLLADTGVRGVATYADVLEKLYGVYRTHDAELVEINPLAVTDKGQVVALDCKFVLDESAAKRRAELAARGVPEQLSELEARGRALGLRYIELGGAIGVLANGAGLTMTTMDVIRHHGGQPANFLEIGGDAYTLAKPALELVLANPRVRALVVNFCGAFARTDVMTAGVIEAWQALKPKVPAFFSIHGTGEDEAVKLLQERLGLKPFDLMDDAIKAAIEAAEALRA